MVKKFTFRLLMFVFITGLFMYKFFQCETCRKTGEGRKNQVVYGCPFRYVYPLGALICLW